VNEEVTRRLHDDYNTGKNATMATAARLVDERGGSFYNKNAAANGMKPPDFGGGNTHYYWIHSGTGAWDVAATIADIGRILSSGYKYIVAGGANDFSSPIHETSAQVLYSWSFA
jgi:hypothetical protein